MKSLTAKLSLAALLSLAAVAFPAYAIDFESAKAQGLVGERPDGYIGAVPSSPSAEVVSLVDSVNRQRKTIYQKTAAENGQTLPIAEKLAGEKLKARLGKGQYYLDAGGNWKQK